MKTEKLNLNERIEKASTFVKCYLRFMAMDIAYHGYVDDLDVQRTKYWLRYLKNTCEMHGLTFSTILLI